MLVDDECIREIDLVGDKPVRVGFKNIGTHHIICNINTRHHGQEKNRINQLLHLFFPHFIDKRLFGKMHQFYTQCRSKSNENRIDHIQIKRTEKIREIPAGKTESGRTQGRH